MKQVIKYKCDFCGETFYLDEDCLRHEDMHKRVNKANQMLKEGKSLFDINRECNIWLNVPDYMKEVTTLNCFTISYLQCCSKPAYRIVHINMNGTLSVLGCGSWSGYYGAEYPITDNRFKDPRPASELFVDPRYVQKCKERW